MVQVCGVIWCAGASFELLYRKSVRALGKVLFDQGVRSITGMMKAGGGQGKLVTPYTELALSTTSTQDASG